MYRSSNKMAKQICSKNVTMEMVYKDNIISGFKGQSLKKREGAIVDGQKVGVKRLTLIKVYKS